MLDLFAVVTTGGVILWTHSPYRHDYGAVLDEVMRRAVIEASCAGDALLVGALEVHWTIQHELGLVFVAAYQRILPLTHVPALLEQAKLYWSKNYAERLRTLPYEPSSDFDSVFAVMSRKVEERDREERRSKEPAKGASPSQGPKRTAAPQRKGKQMRDWGDKVSKEALDSLDLSADKDGPGTTITPASASLVATAEEGKDYRQLEDIEWEPETAAEDEPSTGIWRYFDNLTGQKEIARSDLEDALARMKDHLMQKNVAAEVAAVICDSVGESLIGKKTGAFKSIAQLVRSGTEAAVTRLLRPAAGGDLLEEIRRLEGRRPYVMAFVGVNGVGKSTNLSKVCFWLLQNQLRVLLVAGDTFRSGAVEQLRTHVRNLSAGLPEGRLQLFERGYGKDAAAVAKDAIAVAKGQQIDVVMIDTAGRMQDNAPLMAALAKLVYVNRPDKLIFVGEALVGNEATDQLRKFNGALQDHAPSTGASRIDGILLTKFDTIDDKVGAALTMTFVSGAPILFVGVGQTYTDLRKLNVRSIVHTLLK